MYSIDRPPLHKNFWLPSRRQLLQLKCGDGVKLIFRSGENIERMWVIITKQQDSVEWTGITDNDPIGEDLANALPCGSEVIFHPLDIIQIPTFSMRVIEYFANKKGRTYQTYLESKKQDTREEQSFFDLSLNVIDIQKDNNVIRSKVFIPEENAGFEIIVYDTTSKVLQNTGNEVKINTTPRGVIFKSLGEISDNFVSLLAKKYELKSDKLKMCSEIAFTSLAIGGDLSKITNQPVKFKIFFDQGSENDYFEIYLNLDFKNKRASLDEKDTEYRKAIIASLTNKNI